MEAFDLAVGLRPVRPGWLGRDPELKAGRPQVPRSFGLVKTKGDGEAALDARVLDGPRINPRRSKERCPF